MTITLKEKIGLVVPKAVQRQAGIKTGDRVKFEVSRGVITITASPAEDEYTPAQRRVIDARLDRAEEEIKRGHGSPAFKSIEEFAAALKSDDAKLLHKPGRPARR